MNKHGLMLLMIVGICILSSFILSVVFYLIARKKMAYVIIIFYIPFMLVIKAIYLISKKEKIGNASYVSSNSLHMINQPDAIKYYSDANDMGYFQELVFYNAYLAMKKLELKTMKWNTYTHIVSEEDMNKISIDDARTHGSRVVEYAYINSSFGRYGVKKAIKKSTGIINYVDGKERCFGNVDFRKLEKVMDNLYNNLSPSKQIEFNQLSVKVFGESYK